MLDASEGRCRRRCGRCRSRPAATEGDERGDLLHRRLRHASLAGSAALANGRPATIFFAVAGPAWKRLGSTSLAVFAFTFTHCGLRGRLAALCGCCRSGERQNANTKVRVVSSSLLIIDAVAVGHRCRALRVRISAPFRISPRDSTDTQPTARSPDNAAVRAASRSSGAVATSTRRYSGCSRPAGPHAVEQAQPIDDLVGTMGRHESTRISFGVSFATSADGDVPLDEVEVEVVAGQLGSSRVPMRGATSTGAGEQFLHTERTRHHIVGTGIERFNLLCFRRILRRR